MQKYFFTASWRYVFFSVLLAMTACDRTEPETELDKFNKQLAVSWKISSATLDGVDMTAYYPGLVLIFEPHTLSTMQGVLPLWKPSEGYTIIGTASPFYILRDDGIDMKVVTLDESHLVLEFHYDAAAMGGRLKSLSGEYHIELTLL
jgi:hypothetical protein